MKKIIVHLDMDSFFASCEEKADPSLKGKAIVVGADPKHGKGRGVVSTCSYEARKCGIRSAMPISKAYKLNPKAIFLPVNFRLYGEISKRIMKILRGYSPKIEQTGIDESYLDITELAENFEEAEIVCQSIKKEIAKKEGLTCSIGIASNKLIAKMASDFKKPDGLTIVRDDEIKGFLAPLDVRKLYGVGPKTEERLKHLGVETIGKLAAFSREKLLNEFGSYGIYLSMSANGIGDDFVAEEYGRLSIGRETTFEKDVDDFSIMEATIEELANEIIEDLKEENYLFRTIGIKARLEDFRTFTRAKTLQRPSSNKNDILKVSKILAKEFEGKKIRLIGVRVSNLEDFKGQKTIKEFMV